MLERLPKAVLGRGLLPAIGPEELASMVLVSKASRETIYWFLSRALVDGGDEEVSDPRDLSAMEDVMRRLTAARAAPSWEAAVQPFQLGLECSARGHHLLVSRQNFRNQQVARRALVERLVAYHQEEDKQGPLLPQHKLVNLCTICEAVAKDLSGAMTPGAAAETNELSISVVLHCCRPTPKAYLGGKATALVVDHEEVAMARVLWGKRRPVTDLSLLDIGIGMLEHNEDVTTRIFNDGIKHLAGAPLHQLTGLSVKEWVAYFPFIFSISGNDIVKLHPSPASVPPTPLSRRLSTFVDTILPQHRLFVVHSTCKQSTYKTPRELVSICPKRYGQKQMNTEDVNPHVVALQHHLVLMQQQGQALLSVPLAIMVVLKFFMEQPNYSLLLYLDSAPHLYVKPLLEDGAGASFRMVMKTFQRAYLDSLPSRHMQENRLCVVAPAATMEYLLIGRPLELMARQADQARLWAYYTEAFDYPELVVSTTTLAKQHDWTAEPSPLQEGLVPYHPEGPLCNAALDVRALLRKNKKTAVSVKCLHDLMLQELRWRLEKQLIVKLKESAEQYWSPVDAYESSRGEHLASAIDFSDFFEKSLFDFRCRETAAVAGYMIGADATKELTMPKSGEVVPYLRGWSRDPSPKTDQDGASSESIVAATDLPSAVEKPASTSAILTQQAGAGQMTEQEQATPVTLGKREREEETQTEEEEQKEGEEAVHEG